MTGAAASRVGWCPGALRPMQAGDGLLLRVKPRIGRLDLDRAEALGHLAGEFGNGELDFTARANLQLRGVRPETLDPLIAALADLGLLDPTPEAEAIRNIVASPLAGLDPAVRDIRPVVAAVERHLVGTPELAALPAKWSVVVDDGGAMALTDVSADVRFEAEPDGGFLVGLAGDPVRGRCGADEVPHVAVSLARWAIADQPRRMADLVRAPGAQSLLEAAGLTIATSTPARRRSPSAVNLVGSRDGRVPFAGMAPPFGSLQAGDWLRLIATARAHGAYDLRLTPWRVILAPIADAHDAPALLADLADTALITDPTDPRLSIAACSGRPACHRATTPTRHDAALLAKRLVRRHAPGPAVHVSGCAKGCAHAGPAPWTLIGREGFYDIVKDGKAGDTPVVRGLPFLDAASWISRET